MPTTQLDQSHFAPRLKQLTKKLEAQVLLLLREHVRAPLCKALLPLASGEARSGVGASHNLALLLQLALGIGGGATLLVLLGTEESCCGTHLGLCST